MKTPYEVFQFQVSTGYAAGATLKVRVHAASRDAAWAKVQQMHPRAVMLQEAVSGSSPSSAASKREPIHLAQ
ncbi:MAG: hypothetical protein RIR43_2038 [Pseudomonadota bacterium]